jgi:hypothetical protein
MISRILKTSEILEKKLGIYQKPDEIKRNSLTLQK